MDLRGSQGNLRRNILRENILGHNFDAGIGLHILEISKLLNVKVLVGELFYQNFESPF